MSERSQRDASDFSMILEVLRRRWLVVAVCFLAALAAAVGISLLQTKEYSASASLLFRDPALDQKLFGTSLITPETTDPERQAETNFQLVSLDVVADRTASQIGGGLTGDDVKDKVSVATKGDSDIVSVTAADHSPGAAAALANTFAHKFIAFRRGADRAQIRQAALLIQKRLDDLSPAEQSDALAESLRKRLEDLGIIGSLQTGNAELVEEAVAPTEASSPKPTRNAVFGGLIGLLIGISLALIRERLDRGLKRPEELGEALGMPVIGSVPASHALEGQRWLGGKDGAQLRELPPSEAEAFRMLRANLRYFDVTREIHTALVTSPSAEDGKSTVALNLALAAAESGMSVLLLEADMRHPTLAVTLGLGRDGGRPRSPAGGGPGIGLDSLLSDPDLVLSDASRPIQVAKRPSGDASSGRLDVVMAGGVPPNPTELMETDRMRSLLNEARHSYDLVIIDAPPVLMVADPIPLMKQVDGVLVVGRLASTSREDATRLRHQLEQLDVPTLGVVANFAPQPERYYGYGQGAPAWRLSSPAS